jgi:hypothetical protein
MYRCKPSQDRPNVELCAPGSEEFGPENGLVTYIDSHLEETEEPRIDSTLLIEGGYSLEDMRDLAIRLYLSHTGTKKDLIERLRNFLGILPDGSISPLGLIPDEEEPNGDLISDEEEPNGDLIPDEEEPNGDLMSSGYLEERSNEEPVEEGEEFEEYT